MSKLTLMIAINQIERSVAGKPTMTLSGTPFEAGEELRDTLLGQSAARDANEAELALFEKQNSASKAKVSNKKVEPKVADDADAKAAAAAAAAEAKAAETKPVRNNEDV